MTDSNRILAYYGTDFIAPVKSFMIQAPEHKGLVQMSCLITMFVLSRIYNIYQGFKHFLG